ncbi:diguanylate cyclase [Pseudoduganella sp. DS3]|uniref:diguanylate cyclase n=2 Tax=Pseudoduganella guangdongensis TaxID=2692179 RepID=A0A6N9HAQ0_9BURK|nr:diguanylate cyclase [Pseudoduganella guangdongensis]
MPEGTPPASDRDAQSPGAYHPPSDGRERGRREGYGPPPEGRERGPGAPRDGYGPPPEGRDQRGPRGEGFGGPPPEGRERGPGAPREGYGPPPEGRDQRGPRGEGFGGPPPEGRERGPGAPRDGYGPPPAGREQRDPRPPHPAPAARGDDAQRASIRAAGEPGARPDALHERGPERGPRGDQPPPRRGDGPPPFRFVLADADHKVLLGGGQFRVGDMLPESARATARPIIVKDKTVAYVYSDGAPTPTAQEQKYIDALYNSLWWGIAAAAILATLLGVLLSRGLSRSLSGLTQAVKGMHKGELRQQVEVKGKDEVAALATAFNEMSEQLAQSHEELNASHATIMQQAEQLRELSIRDALTQLYNRRHFDEQANTLFNQAVRHKRPLALVICDIDHFKKINDTYSHATGDVVLRHVGAILRKHMRLSDLVARYGGEEFVMAFPETPGPQAAALCDKLRTLIESYPWHEVHPDLKVTMSMGVYADIAAGSAETMLQKADALLYRAKESGRNRVCFT